MARGQEPRIQAQVFSKKKGLQNNFIRRFPIKKSLQKFFFRLSTKFEQFENYCCPRAEDRAIFEDLRF